MQSGIIFASNGTDVVRPSPNEEANKALSIRARVYFFPPDIVSLDNAQHVRHLFSMSMSLAVSSPLELSLSFIKNSDIEPFIILKHFWI